MKKELRGVGLILMDQDQTGVWLSTRVNPGKIWDGYDQTPGGKVDTGETDEEAILRELKEETGLTGDDLLHPLQYIKDKLYKAPDGMEYIGIHYVSSTDKIPQTIEKGKHTPWRLVVWEDLHECKLMQSTQEALLKVLAESRSALVCDLQELHAIYEGELF